MTNHQPPFTSDRYTQDAGRRTPDCPIDTIERLGAALGGRYAIIREIGAGGMATVFLARDVRHDRDVALKLLRPELGALLGPERFLGEIRVTAHLQHPHLLPLFDSGEANGFLYYVMPFAEGETLRARLTRERQLPIDEALHIATAVASALDYAHRRGVIHRDLKPENILLQDGQPVVSDFGIALAVTHAGGERITQSGISLGTPQYMSPEQATGDRQIDARTDIYSLGCVLYEMLTGDPPHTASTVQGVVAKVLTDRPRSVRATRATVPMHIEAAIDRALEKLPADRWATAADFGEALRAPLRAADDTSRFPAASTAPAVRRRRRLLIGGVALALLGAALAVASWRWLRPVPPRALAVRFVLDLPPELRVRDAAGTTIALSADGTALVYLGRHGAGRQLYLRRLDQLEVKGLAGTENAASPFFSPDGEWVGFFGEDAKLKKVPIGGGTPIVLADAAGVRGGTWGDDDMIIFSGGDALLRVSANGGKVDTLTRPDSANGEAVLHSWPSIVPGGDAVVFTVSTSSVRNARLGVLSLRGPPQRPKYFDQACLSPRAAGRDRILCPLADGSVVAIPFDVRTLSLTGRPEPVLHDAVVKGGGAAVIGLAENGTLAYLRGPTFRQLMRIDDAGHEQPFLDAGQSIEFPRFSPDGRQLAYQSGPPGASDIWIYELPSGPATRLTTGGVSMFPEWSPDSRRVIFAADRGNGFDIYWQLADGSGPAEPLLVAPGDQTEAVMAPNGVDLVARAGNAMSRDIITFRVGEHAARPFAARPRIPEQSPRISPDGKWVTYFANETGRFEIYVQPFSGSGRWTVSDNGGNFPLWSRDGRTLYYWHGTDLVAARVATSPTFKVLSRSVLFEGSPIQGGHAPYDVTPDGTHFVMAKSVSDDAALVVVLNWVDEWRPSGQRPTRAQR